MDNILNIDNITVKTNERLRNIYNESIIDIFCNESDHFQNILLKTNSDTLNESVLVEAEENFLTKIINGIKELFKKLFNVIREFFAMIIEKIGEISKKLIGPFLAKIKEKKNKKVNNESVILYEKENPDYRFYKYAESDIDDFTKKFEEACKHLPKNEIHSMDNMYWVPNIYDNINKSAKQLTENIKLYYERCILSFAKEESDLKLLEDDVINREIYKKLPIANNLTTSGKAIDINTFTDKSFLIEHGVKITTANIMQYHRDIVMCGFNSDSWKKSIKAQFEGAKDYLKQNEKATINIFKNVHSEDNKNYKNTSYLHKAATKLTKTLTNNCSKFFQIQIHFKKLALSLAFKIYMMSDIY